jgi:pimeloyl-ACP methyl ester carboxylesterase
MSGFLLKGKRRSAVKADPKDGQPESRALEVQKPSTPTVSPETPVAMDGITVLTGDDGKAVDVVFVHGLNGSPARTWTHANGFYWPAELGKQLKGARVMVYGYNVSIEPAMGTNNTRIKSIADDLLNEIRQHRRKDPARKRPLVFIGHSLGGLVIKRAIHRASTKKDDDPLHFIYSSTRLVLFFGTPNAGSQLDAMWRIRFLERLGKAVATEVPPNIKAALKMHSDELLDLADDFLEIESIQNKHTKVFSFFELLSYPGIGERVVDETSARLHVPGETYLGINANHVDMVKFSDGSNKTFRSVCSDVEDVEETASTERGAEAQDSSSGSPITDPHGQSQN